MLLRVHLLSPEQWLGTIDQNFYIWFVIYYNYYCSNVHRSSNDINNNNDNSTSPSNVDYSKQAGFFSGLFESNNNNPNSLLEVDPEMEVTQIHNPFATSSSSDLNNPFATSSSDQPNPFASSTGSNEDQVNFLAEGSNKYENYLEGPTPTPSGYSQQVSNRLATFDRKTNKQETN